MDGLRLEQLCALASAGLQPEGKQWREHEEAVMAAKGTGARECRHCGGSGCK